MVTTRRALLLLLTVSANAALSPAAIAAPAGVERVFYDYLLDIEALVNSNAQTKIIFDKVRLLPVEKSRYTRMGGASVHLLAAAEDYAKFQELREAFWEIERTTFEGIDAIKAQARRDEQEAETDFRLGLISQGIYLFKKVSIIEDSGKKTGKLRDEATITVKALEQQELMKLASASENLGKYATSRKRKR